MTQSIPPNSSTRTTSGQWSDELLDSMRLTADPETDKLVATVFYSGGAEAVLELKQFLENWEASPALNLPWEIREFLEKPVQFPGWVDNEKIALAQKMFDSNGPLTLMMILLNALPHVFTNPSAARAFFLAKVFKPDAIKNRMLELSHFTLNMTQSGGLAQAIGDGSSSAGSKNIGLLSAQKLRLIHSTIRVHLKIKHQNQENNWDLLKFGEPINQEDLAEALLDLYLWVNDGLKNIGIGQTPVEQEARLNFWKTVGFLIGLREDLQPGNAAEARTLRDSIARRHSKATPEGAAVTADVLDVMRGMLPRIFKQLPAGLMRYQLGDEVADMLRIPKPRILMWLLTISGPFWKKQKFFAKAATIMTPPLLHWLRHQPRIVDRGQSRFPLSQA